MYQHVEVCGLHISTRYRCEAIIEKVPYLNGAYKVLCSMFKGTYVSRQCEVKYRQVTRANVLIEKEQMCVGVIAVAHASVC